MINPPELPINDKARNDAHIQWRTQKIFMGRFWFRIIVDLTFRITTCRSLLAIAFRT